MLQGSPVVNAPQLEPHQLSCRCVSLFSLVVVIAIAIATVSLTLLARSIGLQRTTTDMAMTIMASRRLGASLCSRFYSSSAATASASPTSSAAASASGEIGVQEFIKSIKGVEAHADKVAQAIIGVPTLLQTRSSRLKKLGIPCKQRKMILRYTEKYRQGIWTPRMSIKQ